MNRYNQETEDVLLYNDFMDIEDFKRMQEKFSKATNTFLVCYDENCNRVTEPSGSEREKELIRNLVDRNILKSILDRVAPGNLEDTAIEDIPALGIKIAAISVVVEGEKCLTWVVVAVISDSEKVKPNYFQKFPWLPLKNNSTGLLIYLEKRHEVFLKTESDT